MRSTVGIDNGLSGYFCLYTDDKVFLSSTPVARGKLSRRLSHIVKDNNGMDYRPAAMLDLIDQAISQDSDVEFICELPLARFAKGRSGSAQIVSLQRSAGIWAAMLSLRGKLLFQVHPSTWKTACGLYRKEKSHSLVVAAELFNVDFPTVDAADAALMAYFFRHAYDFNVEARSVRRQKTGK